MKKNISKITGYGLVALSCVLIGYFVPRSDFIALLVSYLAGFGGLAILYVNNKQFGFWEFIFSGLLLRILLFPSIPALSDDFYRFLWDGHLIAHGHNPFMLLPSEMMTVEGPSRYLTTLYQHMNSPDYYSVYPPVAQYIFGFSAFLGEEDLISNIISMRALLLGFEFGTLVFLYKLSERGLFPLRNLLFYSINPFIIVEVFGNLHLEGTMLFFTLGSLIFIYRRKYFLSALFFGFAIATKLQVLLLLPFFAVYVRSKNSFLYLTIGLLVPVVLFVPFLNPEAIQHYVQSLQLFFQKFEFNASLFYLVRGIGLFVVEYDIVQTAGPILSAIVTVITGCFVFKAYKKPRQFLYYGLLAYCCYFLFSTTVHPWYLIVPLTLGLMTNLKFPLVWAAMSVLSYSAYSGGPVSENPFLLITEYGVALGFAAWELGIHKTIPVDQPKEPA